MGNATFAGDVSGLAAPPALASPAERGSSLSAPLTSFSEAVAASAAGGKEGRRAVAVRKRSDKSHADAVEFSRRHHKYHREVTKLASAFALYDQNPRSESAIPAYATACIGEPDCVYLPQHIDRIYEFGVGYFVWFINTEDAETRAIGAFLASVFPGRFIPMYSRGQRVGASGTWNRFIDMFFKHTSTPIPWFLNVNGDFFPRDDYLEDFIRYMQHIMLTNPRHTIIKFQHYSFFAYTYRAYMVLGTFDESVYPAYGEDVEMVYRARSMGLTFDDYKAQPKEYSHVGSASQHSPESRGYTRRWSRDNYMRQKWNVDMTSAHWEDIDFTPLHKYPWGFASIPHRSSYSIDRLHEHCIRTDVGAKIPFIFRGEKCFWHGSVVSRLMPKGERPDKVFMSLQPWNLIGMDTVRWVWRRIVAA